MPQLQPYAGRRSGLLILPSRMAARLVSFARLGSSQAVLAAVLAVCGWVAAPQVGASGHPVTWADRGNASFASSSTAAKGSIAPSDWQLERSEFPLYLDHETCLLLEPSSGVGQPAGLAASVVEQEILESVCEIYHLYGPQSLDELWIEPLETPAHPGAPGLGRLVERALVSAVDLIRVDLRAERLQGAIGVWAADMQGYAKAAPLPVTRAWARLQADLDAIAWVARYRPSRSTVAASTATVKAAAVRSAAVNSAAVNSAAVSSAVSSRSALGTDVSKPLRAYSVQYTKPAAQLPQVDPSDWLAPQHSRAASQPSLLDGDDPGSRGSGAYGTGSESIPAAAAPATTEPPVQRLEPSLYWEVFERQAAELGALLRAWRDRVAPAATDLYRQAEGVVVRMSHRQWLAIGEWADRSWEQLAGRFSDRRQGVEALPVLQPEPTASYVGLEPAILGVFEALERVWARWQDQGRGWLVRVTELQGMQNNAWERMVLERIDAVRR